jgi:hypothetical protein
MQEKLADGFRIVQEAGEFLKEKATELNHELDDARHRLMPKPAPSRMQRIRQRLATVAAPLVAAITAITAVTATVLVRRHRHPKK